MYLLSAVGMVLFIIGLFNSFHFVVGNIAYDKYPLHYGVESRCDYLYKPTPVGGQTDTKSDKELQDACFQGLKKERANTRIDDLEKSIAFTIIGLLVFGAHFYFVYKERKEDNERKNREKGII